MHEGSAPICGKGALAATALPAKQRRAIRAQTRGRAPLEGLVGETSCVSCVDCVFWFSDLWERLGASWGTASPFPTCFAELYLMITIVTITIMIIIIISSSSSSSGSSSSSSSSVFMITIIMSIMTIMITCLCIHVYIYIYIYIIYRER